MKFKKLMSLSTLCVVGVLGVGLLAGCNNDDDIDVPSDDVDDTETETETGPQSGSVLGNALNMLSGFTFEGSIDIAYGDIEVGLEFSNGEAVIPLDLSDYSFDIAKLAVGGDLTIKYDEYNVTLGVTYLDSAVYVDYGEDSYWSEGVGDSVHFYMENSDIGDLINLFSSDDDEASSVDWEALFGLDLTDFQVMDLVNDLGVMDLTTAKDGSPAFAFPLTSLGIDDSILIRTNDNSECTGLECSEVELGEFTLSIDLSLATKKGLEVSTREDKALYSDLAGVNSLISSIYDIIEYKYYSLSGVITLDLGAYGLVRGVEIPTTLTMRISDEGQFTMLIDCDIPIYVANFILMEVGLTDGGKLVEKEFTSSFDWSSFKTVSDWSTTSGAESRHTTVYYDSEEGNTYFYRKDIGEGHVYTESGSIDPDNPTSGDYTKGEACNTYEQWGMLSGSEFGNSAFVYILDNMIGCGEMITSALESDEEDAGMEFTIPTDLNGLITKLETSTDSEGNWTIDLGVSAGPFLGGSLAMLDKANVSVTLDSKGACSNVTASVPIEVDYNGIAAEFTIGLDFDVNEGTGKEIPSGYEKGGTNDPFAEFEAYIAAHTCTCEECDCESGECDEGCECCSEGCECYFIPDTIVEKLWLDESLPCSCGCESCVLGQCNCAEGSCECSDGGCTCTTDDGGDTEPDDENP